AESIRPNGPRNCPATFRRWPRASNSGTLHGSPARTPDLPDTGPCRGTDWPCSRPPKGSNPAVSLPAHDRQLRLRHPEGTLARGREADLDGPQRAGARDLRDPPHAVLVVAHRHALGEVLRLTTAGRLARGWVLVLAWFDAGVRPALGRSGRAAAP